MNIETSFQTADDLIKSGVKPVDLIGQFVYIPAKYLARLSGGGEIFKVGGIHTQLKIVLPVNHLCEASGWVGWEKCHVIPADHVEVQKREIWIFKE